MKKEDFLKLTREKIVILDGGTGSELTARGMPRGICPEKWILDNPGIVCELQRSYRESGSDIIYAPTFGANPFKLDEFGFGSDCIDINRRLVMMTKEAVPDALCFGNLAPTGRFVEPFGELQFEEAVDAYKKQVRGCMQGGADGFVIETMMDIQEARAALIAIKEMCGLPVMVSMTFGRDGLTLNGTDPLTAVITLQSLGADAVGCNCSTGPENMPVIIAAMKPAAKVPLLAKPNAGMPRLENGRTRYDMSPEEFAGYADAFIDAGVNLIGGCCGTTPEHILHIARKVRNKKGKQPAVTSVSAVSSSRRTLFIGQKYPLTIIGERINPTGKKPLQEELRQGKFGIVKQFALEQAGNGASILDVNMGLSGIDEKEMMTGAIRNISRISDLPLCIDTTKPDVAEAALRIYPGRAIVNSISAEADRIEKTLPIAAKYGAMFVLLPLTDRGIPKTLDERKRAVEYVLEKAAMYGYTKHDAAVDGLVMTISSDQSAAGLTLDLIEWCAKDLDVNTVCGLSNVSFGLPERQWINNAFLLMAVSRGLTMTIANPSSEMIMSLAGASDALTGRDNKLARYIRRFAHPKGNEDIKDITSAGAVYQSVIRGDADKIGELIRKSLEDKYTPQQIVDEYLIPAINEVGEKFDKKEFFLPQLIVSADTMRRGFEILEPYLKKDSSGTLKKEATVIIATVQGDIHDIGKNIVTLMLKNYNFEVIDLGKDVAAEDIIRMAKNKKADIIALSALMTTTMIEMKSVIECARREGLAGVRFMVGGAVVDQDYADEIGAHGYASDAFEAVKLARKLSHDKPAE